MTANFHAIRLTLQAEGALIGAAAIFAFAQVGGSWMQFALLILAPDLAMLGYLKDSKLGAICYNLAHNYLLPAALAGLGLAISSDLALQIALIWIAHVGLDRGIGYGLKYAHAFKDTHLNHV